MEKLSAAQTLSSVKDDANRQKGTDTL